MKPARRNRSLLAWMLYLNILVAALVCAIGHGQSTGLQLSGLDGAQCSLADGGLDGGRHPGSATLAGDDCVLSSSFSAAILAALFGLFMRIAPQAPRPLPRAVQRHPVRHAWPPANPRASPLAVA